MSAPFRGAIGNMVVKGFDVIRRNNRNPTKIKEIMPIVLGFKI
jgi:hypothetical protein